MVNEQKEESIETGNPTSDFNRVNINSTDISNPVSMSDRESQMQVKIKPPLASGRNKPP